MFDSFTIVSCMHEPDNLLSHPDEVSVGAGPQQATRLQMAAEAATAAAQHMFIPLSNHRKIMQKIPVVNRFNSLSI